MSDASCSSSSRSCFARKGQSLCDGRPGATYTYMDEFGFVKKYVIVSIGGARVCLQYGTYIHAAAVHDYFLPWSTYMSGSGYDVYTPIHM